MKQYHNEKKINKSQTFYLLKFKMFEDLKNYFYIEIQKYMKNMWPILSI